MNVADYIKKQKAKNLSVEKILKEVKLKLFDLRTLENLTTTPEEDIDFYMRVERALIYNKNK